LALEDNTLLGTATLDSDDLPGFEHLSPWLASVFVRPEARGCGVAAALIAHIEGVAFDNGVQHLYLHTHDQSAYYQKRGWVVMQTVHAWGKTTTIMTKDAARHETQKNLG
jgi:N-acetylglutamate synthase-like GNAT family acetyltransferase